MYPENFVVRVPGIVSHTVPSGAINTLVPRLKSLEVAQRLDAHSGLVRDLQFSPDGSFLATTG